MSELPATELLPLPDTGRTFTAERTARLGDVDPNGDVRLDAVARYLQDVATDDAVAAGFSNAMGWLVRRSMIRVVKPAVLNERLELVTFCTGFGRSWAERRTTVRGAGGAEMDGVSLWVQIDVESGRPARLTDEFVEVYGEAAAGRTVSSKFTLGRDPTPDARPTLNPFRATDLDVFGHLNNAAQWVLAETLVQEHGLPRAGVGEIEFVTASQVDGEALAIVTDVGFDAWYRADDATSTVFRWRPVA